MRLHTILSTIHVVVAASYVLRPLPALRSNTACHKPRCGASCAITSPELPTGPRSASADSWKWWFAVPFLAPYGERRTELREIVANEVWTLEQLQGTFMVHVPVRATVVKLQSTGGLLVYAPVAPTPRCVEMVKKLEEMHGPVQHVILPTVCIEHKFLAGPFARCFPGAQCWVAPDQYALPVNLPLPFLGFPIGTKTLPPTEVGTPWAQDCDHALLGPLNSKQGKFEVRPHSLLEPVLVPADRLASLALLHLLRDSCRTHALMIAPRLALHRKLLSSIAPPVR